MSKVLDGLLNELKQEITGGKVIKSLPMKAEWEKKWQQFSDCHDQMIALKQKAETLRRSFWSTVEIDTGIYDKQFRVNTELNEIEVIGDDEE